MYDCIIIGAGAAGASAAYHLAKVGHSVLVVEQARLPRYKPCGGGVSPAIADWFDFDFEPTIEQKLDTIKFTWKMDDPVEVKLEDVQPMWIVKRDRFDQYLLQQAQQQGAEVKDNTHVTGVKFQGTQWQITTNNGSYEATYLIAADGVNSHTVAALGLSQPVSCTAAVLEIQAPVSENRQNRAYFDFGSLKNGYLFAFPKADGYSISGLYLRGRNQKPLQLRQQITAYAAKFGLDANSGQYWEHPAAVWNQSTTLHAQQAIVVGEAAGVADPLTGEGIRPAIFTACKGAEAIASALGGNPQAIAQYTETIQQQWGSEMAIADRVAGLFYKFPQIAYRLGVKVPSASQIMAKTLTGELGYSQIIDRVTSRLTPWKR